MVACTIKLLNQNSSDMYRNICYINMTTLKSCYKTAFLYQVWCDHDQSIAWETCIAVLVMVDIVVPVVVAVDYYPTSKLYSVFWMQYN